MPRYLLICGARRASGFFRLRHGAALGACAAMPRYLLICGARGRFPSVSTRAVQKPTSLKIPYDPLRARRAASSERRGSPARLYRAGAVPSTAAAHRLLQCSTKPHYPGCFQKRPSAPARRFRAQSGCKRPRFRQIQSGNPPRAGRPPISP